MLRCWEIHIHVIIIIISLHFRFLWCKMSFKKMVKTRYLAVLPLTIKFLASLWKQCSLQLIINSLVKKNIRVWSKKCFNLQTRRSTEICRAVPFCMNCCDTICPSTFCSGIIFPIILIVSVFFVRVILLRSRMRERETSRTALAWDRSRSTFTLS